MYSNSLEEKVCELPTGARKHTAQNKCIIMLILYFSVTTIVQFIYKAGNSEYNLCLICEFESGSGC